MYPTDERRYRGRRRERRYNRRKKYSELSVPEKKAEFLKHLRTYLVMSVFFVVLNTFGNSGHFWAIYPIAGWGIAVAMQYFSLYGPMRDREIESEEEFEEFEDFDINQRPERPIELPEARNRTTYREEDLL